jgi:hypothetical protein
LTPEVRIPATQLGAEDWQSLQHSLESGCEIAKEMKAIGHLNGARCTLPGPLGIRARAVAADDLDAWVKPQPLSQRSWFPVGQKVNRLVTFEINQNRSVAMASAPRPVIYSKHSYAAMTLRIGTPL